VASRSSNLVLTKNLYYNKIGQQTISVEFTFILQGKRLNKRIKIFIVSVKFTIFLQEKIKPMELSYKNVISNRCNSQSLTVQDVLYYTFLYIIILSFFGNRTIVGNLCSNNLKLK